MLGEEEEEAPKRDPAISLHDQDMEDINDVWNTFRLPIPIPQINSNNRSNNQNEWLLQVVDQLRLLQTMKEQYANPNNGTPYRSSSRHQRMKGQINFAISGQARIEQTFPSSPQMTTNDDDTKIIDDGDYTHQPIFYENAHRLVQTMRAETEDICEKFHEWLSRHPEQLQMQENVIANIFFAPLEPVATQDKPLDELSVEGDGDGDEFDDDDEDLKQQVPTQKRSQSTTRKLIPTNQQYFSRPPVKLTLSRDLFDKIVPPQLHHVHQRRQILVLYFLLPPLLLLHHPHRHHFQRHYYSRRTEGEYPSVPRGHPPYFFSSPAYLPLPIGRAWRMSQGHRPFLCACLALVLRDRCPFLTFIIIVLGSTRFAVSVAVILANIGLSALCLSNFARVS